jgi:TonB family protein
LQTAPYFRMRPKTVNGAPVSGARVDIPLTWLLETPVRHEMVVETPGVATPPSSDREWEADYAEPVQAVGEQGVVWVRAKVGLDGVPSNVTVRDSARSLALDRAAVAALAEWRFTPARNAAGQPMAATIAVKFEFETPDLRTKTCAALTAHAAWVARAWPERRIADFPLYRNGRAYASTYLREWKKYGGEVAFDTKYAAAFAWTLKACTAQPDAKFVDVLASGFTDTPD